MINAYSQRMTPPYSGQVQIAESDRARAVTMDGKNWEFYFLYTVPGDDKNPDRRYQRRHSPVAMIDSKEFEKLAAQSTAESKNLDENILELVVFLSTASLPFPAADKYEYWLLDPIDESPLALVFSCVDSELMESFPARTEWSALPAAVMKIERTPDEEASGDPPVNYQVERMVAERAGYNAKARWFNRHEAETVSFPPLLLKEEWQEESQSDLCQRYLRRQSSRLLMLHDLPHEDRKRLEISARRHVFETERFFPCYPDVVDQKLMNSILVEARLRRGTSPDETHLLNRRDGVHYL